MGPIMPASDIFLSWTWACFIARSGPFFGAKNHASKNWTRQKQISGLAIHLIKTKQKQNLSFLTVYLLFKCHFVADKGNYPENSHIVFCPN